MGEKKIYIVRYKGDNQVIRADCAKGAASIIARQNNQFDISRIHGGTPKSGEYITVYRQDKAGLSRVYLYRVNGERTQKNGMA